nr:hypothetical protein BaRGS_029350 [Batillaria attramentaria]
MMMMMMQRKAGKLLPKTRNFFKDIPLLDLGSAKPLTVQEKSEMIRKHTEASKRYASDDEISDIIACDKTGPFFPWCCREYARSEGKHSSTYVTFKTGPIGYEIFSSMLSLAYVSFFCKVLRDPNSQAGLLQLFALTMEGGFPVDYHIDEVQEELNNLELGAEHEQVSEMHRLNVLFRGSLLDAGGIDFSSRDIYEAFGFALFETGQVELLLRVCDVQFLVQHVHIQALETTGPALILTPRSSGYFTFVFRVMKEIVGGNCVQISQHPAMHQAPFLADVERFLRGRGLVQTAFATSDPRYGMPLLYWSAWTGPSVLTLWCLKTPGNYEAQKSPRTETGPQRMHTAKPAPAGGEGTPDWCEEDEQYDVLVPDWVQRRTSTRSTKSGSSVRRSRLPVPPANSPPTRAPSSQALLLRRMFLACCLLGEKVDTPRVAQTLELLCQDEALRDDSMSRVELPIPSEEDLLNDAIVAKCQHVRSKAPVLYLGLAGPNASVRIKSSSRVSIPTSIVKVEMNLAKDHVLIKPEGCCRWYTLLRLLSMCHVNELNRDGYTLMHTAAFNGELSVLWFLAINGGDLMATTSRGNTPLTKAIDKNQVKVAAFILQHGCQGRKPNAQDLTNLCGGRSVGDLLRGAVVCRRAEMLRLLLRHGADPNARDSKGRSLLNIARAIHDNHEVIRALAEHGAK